MPPRAAGAGKKFFKKFLKKVLTFETISIIIDIESEVNKVAKRKRKGDKVEATNLITALINLIAVMLNLIYLLLDRGR